MTRRTKKSSYGSYLQQVNETSAETPLETADVENKQTEETKKATRDTSQNEERESGTVLNSSFDDRPSQSQAPPDYIASSMAIEEVDRSWARSCHQPPWLREWGTNDK